MKYKFLLNCNFCFSKLVTTFLLIMYNFLIGQSVVTDIVRDGKGNISSIEYYSTVSKKLELLKLETFHPNGHISTLESFSSGLKNGSIKNSIIMEILKLMDNILMVTKVDFGLNILEKVVR